MGGIELTRLISEKVEAIAFLFSFSQTKFSRFHGKKTRPLCLSRHASLMCMRTVSPYASSSSWFILCRRSEQLKHVTAHTRRR